MTDDTDHRTLAFRADFSFPFFSYLIMEQTLELAGGPLLLWISSTDGSRSDHARRHGFGVRSGSFPLILFFSRVHVGYTPASWPS